MRYIQLCGLLFCLSCQTPSIQNPITTALQSNDPNIQTVMTNLETYELQIMLSKIQRTDTAISFEDYEFQVNDSLYFYPASTVKLPVAILSLEKLHQQDTLDMDLPFYVEGDTITSTIKKDILDIFAVSSNTTYNRLFEYLGKDYINQELVQKSITPIRISHRLSTDNAYDLETKPLIFSKNDSTLMTTSPIYNSDIVSLSLKSIKKGKGFYKNGILVNEPMDFSLKNYMPIRTQNAILKRLFFPEAFPVEARFKLSDKHYKFIKNAMAITPKEIGYDPKTYYDSYVKFFMFGDSKKAIPSHIKIYNKVGYAYGYLTDNAYIVDTKNHIEYILTATIHVNNNGIFNDDTYEYEAVGIPFLAALGREIHHQISSSQ